ncbi:MAG: YybH family protein [Flavobacteriaceae bacterium]
MIKNTILAGLTLLIMASCSHTKKQETMIATEKQQIEKLLEVYKESLNSSDAVLATSLYTKDGIFMPTQAPSGIGQDGILNSYNFVFSQIQLNVEFFIEEIQVEGDMAFAVTNSKGTVKIHANGQEVPEENRELFVFEKVNGNWLISKYMFNKTK